MKSLDARPFICPSTFSHLPWSRAPSNLRTRGPAKVREKRVTMRRRSRAPSWRWWRGWAGDSTTSRQGCISRVETRHPTTSQSRRRQESVLLLPPQPPPKWHKDQKQANASWRDYRRWFWMPWPRRSTSWRKPAEGPCPVRQQQKLLRLH